MAPRTTEQFETIRQERRKEIMEAALHVFAENGYHSSSISRIAKEAGVSKGLMYNYFKSKEELLVQMVNAMFDEVEMLFPIDENERLSDKRLREWIMFSMDIVMQEPKRWKLYTALVMQPDVAPLLLEKMPQRVAPYMKVLVDYFQRKGYDDPLAMARYFSAVLDGVQMHMLFDPETFPREKVKQYLIDQFI